MKLKIASIVLFLISIFLSCNKTEYEVEQRPDTEMLSFAFDHQYLGADQVRGVIAGDSIIVYWSSKVERPTTVRPVISVAKGASISPASGDAVAFSEGTKYTITAENGVTRDYTLKIKSNQEVPIISAIVGNFDYLNVVTGGTWPVDPAKLTLNFLGEYLLSTGDVNDIKVYIQRLHDGYEIDLPVNAETATNTTLQVDLPKFSNQLDTGRHRIWVQVGDLVSDSKDFFMRAPHISTNGTVEGEFLQRDSEIYAGQKLTMKYKFSDGVDGAITRYYTTSNLHGVYVNVRALERVDTIVNAGRVTYRDIFKTKNYLLTDFEATDTEVNFSLPSDLEDFVGGNLMSIQFLYKYINEEGIWTHLNTGGAVQFGQSVAFTRGVVTQPGNSRIGPPIVSAKGR